MTDDDIREACLRHGAKRVHDAACQAMSGNRVPLHRLGLQSSSVSADHAIMALAYKLMTDAEQAGDLAGAVIAAARLP